jgi:cold-inducible RNA-binding protein
MSRKLYVGNLPYAITDQDLQQIFSNIGQVTSARVIFDRETGRSKGFGFVEMSTEDEARKAISEYDNGDLEGRRLRVSEAKPVEPRMAGGGPRGFESGGFRGQQRW